MLGVCLGSQILAECLGSRVYRNELKEIGWLPVRVRSEAVKGSLLDGLPEELSILHWHGETYDLPNASLHPAASDGCAVQAFEHPTALGLRFHFEATRAGIRALLANCHDGTGSGPYEQPPEAILGGETLHGSEARSAVFHQ